MYITYKRERERERERKKGREGLRLRESLNILYNYIIIV